MRNLDEELRSVREMWQEYPGVLMILVKGDTARTFGNDAIALINATGGELEYAKGNEPYFEFPLVEVDWRIPSLMARGISIGIAQELKKPRIDVCLN